MARIFKVKQFDLRKRALAAESQVYRETLRLELHNLRLYRVHVQRKVHALANSPLVRFASFAGSALAGAGGLTGLFGRAPARKRRGRWRRLASAAFMGFRLARTFAPLLPTLLSRATLRHGPTGPAEDQSRASGI